MPIDKTIKQYSNFSKGIMTESTPLNFPDNYSLDEQNLLLRVDGSRERRLGIEYETGHAITQTTTLTDSVGMAFYEWEFADDKVANTLGVVQVGQSLYFMDLEQDAPSANLKNSGSAVSITSYMKDSTVQTPQLNFATINGILLVASDSFANPLKVEYTTSTDTITVTALTITVRDLWGVDDGLEVDEEIGTLSDEHNYNLLNQGWTSGNITTYNTAIGVYPGNHKAMYFGKDSTGAWTPATLNETFFGNSQVPRGKFIINFFARGTAREAASGVSNLNLDSESGMFGAVAANFGRVFWAGSESVTLGADSKSPNSSSLILFSQIVERDEQITQCYTEADPTAETINNQVDSDGGFIQIPELGKVVKMVPLNNQLVIFATNGVWTINTDAGLFTPTNYQVNKITDVGVSGLDSIVNVEGTVVYWSESGIYQMTLNEISQQAVVQDVTLQTIKTFYNGISTDAKSNAKGYYDSVNKQVSWLYQSDSDWDFTNYPDHCDKELIYDLQLQAFTVNKISSKLTGSPYIVGAVLGKTSVTSTDVSEVQVNGDQVQVSGDDVQITTTQTLTTNTKVKFLTYVPQNGFASFTLSAYSAEEYLDWGTEDYDSYLETGYVSFEDWARTKTVPYLIAHFERTEDGFNADLSPKNESSCFIQAKWGWSNSANSNKWGTQFQAYRYRRPYVPVDSDDEFDTGHLIITTRNKIRGAGKAISFRFSSESGKNFKLYGFAISATGATSV